MPGTPIRVLSVASEVYPLIKTGGLADVVGALPGALRREGIATRTIVPGYRPVLRRLVAPEPVLHFDHLFGGPARLLASSTAGLDLLVLDAAHLFDRPGGPYQREPGADWPDNAVRFAALGRAAAAVGRGALPGFVPDVVHAHDWQAGLALAFLHYAGAPRPGLVMTVHNLAFQGQFDAGLMPLLGLPPASFSIEGVEYYGRVGYLKAGLWCADRITTVSPGYAQEIQTDAGGMGLGGLLRSRAAVLSGILNGIDTAVWNPATDLYLAEPYDAAGRKAGRAANKAVLRRRFGLAADRDRMLLGVVSRLEWQKGMDLLLDCLPILRAADLQLVLLGSGERGLRDGFVAAQRAHPDRIGVSIGYDEPLAHLIQGGSDAILVPSRFEPCGLTQLCALRYGAVPVVARVGGLADTIIDANEAALAAGAATGIQFYPPSRDRLAAAIARAAALWRDQAAWQRMQRNAMAAQVGWTRSAQHYAALYRELRERVRGGR